VFHDLVEFLSLLNPVSALPVSFPFLLYAVQIGGHIVRLPVAAQFAEVRHGGSVVAVADCAVQQQGVMPVLPFFYAV
jgi:hypothetical protein